MSSIFYFNCINNFSNYRKMFNVGLIIIGNEILNGQVQDENTYFVAKQLPVLGCRLKQISVIPDEIDFISKEVSKFSHECDYVITSGGVGTTHDDVTFEGVACAFEESVHQHKEFTELLIKHYNITGDAIKTDCKLKMARIPESAQLMYGFDNDASVKIPYPVVFTKNVFILPGIPSLFRKGFNIIKNVFSGNNDKLHVDSLYFAIDESQLTDNLNMVVSEFVDSVIFGSYPVLNNNFYKVKISMESKDETKIQLAKNRLKEVIGEVHISKYDPCVFSKAAENVYKVTNINKVILSLERIKKAFETFQPHEMAIAFTGGKDCTVLLHLVYAFMQKNQPNSSMIRVLFVRSRPSFEEVEDFIRRSLINYKIIPPKTNFLEYNGSIKTSLENLSKDHPEIKAIFMGTKKTDPNGNQNTFSKTTEGWPEYVLINPILDWTYSEIWKFLLDLSIPYCCLYDRGYTSLGGIDNTLPNPRLFHFDLYGKPCYFPAYHMKEESAERIGRQVLNTNIHNDNQ